MLATHLLRMPHPVHPAAKRDSAHRRPARLLGCLFGPRQRRDPFAGLGLEPPARLGGGLRCRFGLVAAIRPPTVRAWNARATGTQVRSGWRILGSPRPGSGRRPSSTCPGATLAGPNTFPARGTRRAPSSRMLRRESQRLPSSFPRRTTGSRPGWRRRKRRPRSTNRSRSRREESAARSRLSASRRLRKNGGWAGRPLPARLGPGRGCRPAGVSAFYRDAGRATNSKIRATSLPLLEGKAANSPLSRNSSLERAAIRIAPCRPAGQVRHARKAWSTCHDSN